MAGKTWRTGGLIAGMAAVAAAGWALRDIPSALGAKPSGDREARMRRSPQFHGAAFDNSTPTTVMPRGQGLQILREAVLGRQQRTPVGVVPIVVPTPGTPTGLDVVWYGHATTLVEIEGRRVMFDPVWSDRCSPSSLVGPRRLHPPPVPLIDVPALDAIVISHDHYDHLDMPTVRTLTATQSAPFLVPLGVGAHLEKWGVPLSRIVELDWDEDVTVAGLRFTMTEARHFSGRVFSRNQTLWGSWVVAGESRRVFYTGDSGYFEGYAKIGEAYGPFDLTLIQIGAYSPNWPDIHMTPEDAITAHLDLRGELLLPVHWATFSLAFHAWSEPIDRLWREAKAQGVRLAVPRPGEWFSVDEPPIVDGWWQGIS